MMRNAWHITGGEGAAANSSNKRVLVTHSDGSQSVVTIENDLGLKANDIQGMMQRLRAQGVDVIAISTSGDTESGPEPPSGAGKKSIKRPGTAGNNRSSTSNNNNNNNNSNRLYKSELEAVSQSTEASPGIQMLINRIKQAMKQRGGNGFQGLQRRFRIMDDDNSGNLSLKEFKKALQEMNFDLSETDLRNLFSFFDRDRSGNIDFEEFVQGIRDPMNGKRVGFVMQAFRILDIDGNGEIDVTEIAKKYDASKHPEVIAKRKTTSQVLREFLDNFDVNSTNVKDGKVAKEEFINYYANLSASIDNDDYFELMMRNAWHLSGGVGAAANSSNMRVLVTNSKGQEQTITLENDLGVKRDDYPQIYARLRAQGVEDILAINGKIIQILNINGVEVISIKTGATVSSILNDQRQGKASQGPPPLQVLRAPPPAPAASRNGISNSGGNNSARNNPATNNAKAIYTTMQQRQQSAKVQAQLKIMGETLFNVIRTQLLAKGAEGIINLQRIFQDMDRDGNHSIDQEELQLALQQMNLIFSKEQINALFYYLDADESGGIDFQEMLQGLRVSLI
jgi:calcyphosin